MSEDIKAAVLAERERCATICDRLSAGSIPDPAFAWLQYAAEEIRKEPA